MKLTFYIKPGTPAVYLPSAHTVKGWANRGFHKAGWNLPATVESESVAIIDMSDITPGTIVAVQQYDWYRNDWPLHQYYQVGNGRLILLPSRAVAKLVWEGLQSVD